MSPIGHKTFDTVDYKLLIATYVAEKEDWFPL